MPMIRIETLHDRNGVQKIQENDDMVRADCVLIEPMAQHSDTKRLYQQVILDAIESQGQFQAKVDPPLAAIRMSFGFGVDILLYFEWPNVPISSVHPGILTTLLYDNSLCQCLQISQVIR